MPLFPHSGRLCHNPSNCRHHTIVVVELSSMLATRRATRSKPTRILEHKARVTSDEQAPIEILYWKLPDDVGKYPMLPGYLCSHTFIRFVPLISDLMITQPFPFSPSHLPSRFYGSMRAQMTWEHTFPHDITYGLHAVQQPQANPDPTQPHGENPDGFPIVLS
jgi:hypothetical protein